MTIVASTVEDLVANKGGFREFCCHWQLWKVWSASLDKSWKTQNPSFDKDPSYLKMQFSNTWIKNALQNACNGMESKESEFSSFVMFGVIISIDVENPS